MSGEGATLRSSRAFASAVSDDLPSVGQGSAADDAELLAAARVVAAAFADAVKRGELGPHRYAALLRLDAALQKFPGPAEPANVGGTAFRPPGGGDAHPGARTPFAPPRPAADPASGAGA